MKSLGLMFKYSVLLPKKSAAFQLNRLGMDTTVFYLFILLALSSLPTYFEQLAVSEDLNIFFFSIFFFIFHYLVVVLIVFVALSIFAFIGLIITKTTKRRLHFSVLWKTVGSSTTLPLLFYTIIAPFYKLGSLYLAFSIGFIFLILIKVIFIYPQQHKTKS